MTLLALKGSTPAERVEAIQNLATYLLSMEKTHPASLELTEHFCNGVYIRELLIPAGTTLVGEEHLEDHLCIVLEGEIEIASDDTVRTMYGGEILISKAGTKRAGYAIQDTRWLVVIASDKTDGEEIRQEKIKNPRDFGDKLCHSHSQQQQL